VNQFNTFNEVLLGNLANFSANGNTVHMTGNLTSGNVHAVSLFLNATAPDICGQCGVYTPLTLCEKWASQSKTFNGDQLAMMTAVVTGVFGDETADPVGVTFFNGKVPCQSRDFVDNALIRNALVTQLVAFFGSAGVLGCTQSNFPQYTGNTNMSEVHQYMPITQSVFDLFVNSLVSVVTSALQADVQSLSADLAAVGALLNSPGVYEICNQADCTKNPTNNPPNGVAFFIDKAANPMLCPTPPTKSTAATSTAGTTASTAGTTGAGSTSSTAGSTGGSTTGATTGTTNTPTKASTASSTMVFSVLVALLCGALVL